MHDSPGAPRSARAGVAALALALGVLTASPAGAFEAPAAPSPDVLIVDRGTTDPAGPLDLVLFVRLVPARRAVEITARAARHPAYPAALFHDTDVVIRLTLPVETVLESGRLGWSGALRGDETAEVTATVRIPGDVDAAIEASVTGQGAGGRVDADVERFYVTARGDAIGLSRDPISGAGPSLRPGTSTR